MPLDGGSARAIRWRLIGLTVVLVLVLAAASIRPAAGICDMRYPVWSTDPCGAGAGEAPSLLDYIWPPSHWFAPSTGGLMMEVQHL